MNSLIGIPMRMRLKFRTQLTRRLASWLRIVRGASRTWLTTCKSWDTLRRSPSSVGLPNLRLRCAVKRTRVAGKTKLINGWRKKSKRYVILNWRCSVRILTNLNVLQTINRLLNKQVSRSRGKIGEGSGDEADLPGPEQHAAAVAAVRTPMPDPAFMFRYSSTASGATLSLPLPPAAEHGAPRREPTDLYAQTWSNMFEQPQPRPKAKASLSS